LKSELSDTWLHWYWGKEHKVEPKVRKVARLFKEKQVSNVLDIGCGTGRNSLFLAKKGFEVYAFDQSKNAVKRAKELATKENLKLKIRTWDMTHFPYPYPSSYFSAVLSTKVIHHATIGNIRRIASEISRITKNGSYLFLEVASIIELQNIRDESFKKIGERTIIFLDGNEKGIVHHYFTKQELRALFPKFKVLEIETQEEHYFLIAVKI
jgi:SAM-dependent methyltransferase